MQVEVDLKRMQTNFGGRGLSGFRVMARFRMPSKTAKISLWTMGVKKYNWLNKFMQVEVDVKCMQTNFGGPGLSGFGDFAPFSFAFKTAIISIWTLDYSSWRSKNRIGSKNLCKERCMHTN